MDQKMWQSKAKTHCQLAEKVHKCMSACTLTEMSTSGLKNAAFSVRFGLLPTHTHSVLSHLSQCVHRRLPGYPVCLHEELFCGRWGNFWVIGLIRLSENYVVAWKEQQQKWGRPSAAAHCIYLSDWCTRTPDKLFHSSPEVKDLVMNNTPYLLHVEVKQSLTAWTERGDVL